MNRLQISLTEEQYDFLKTQAFLSGQSMASVLRSLIDEHMAAERQEALTEDPIWAVIGIGQEIDGPTDVSANLDKYLYGEPLETADSPALRKIAEKPDEYHPD
jgi:hypothetical protein